MLGRPRFGAWRTAVPQVEGHRRLFRIFAEISQGLAVQRVVSSEQHTGSTEFRGYVGPRAVLARPMTHTALQGFIRVSCKHAIRFEPSASLRELRVHRSHAVLVVAPRDEVPEGPGHAYGRPGSAVFPSLLLLSERFRLTFNEQQVIKQGPKSRLTPYIPGRRSARFSWSTRWSRISSEGASKRGGITSTVSLIAGRLGIRNTAGSNDAPRRLVPPHGRRPGVRRERPGRGDITVRGVGAHEPAEV